MSGEKLSGNSSEDPVRASAWDELVKLNQEYPDNSSKNPVGPSKEFRQESQMYRGIGEEFISKMNDAAKEATGVRDEQDLGEMLQEKASWKRQIDEGVNNLEREIPSADKVLESQGKNNGRDPITGEQTEDTPFEKIQDPKKNAMLRDGFLNSQSDYVYSFAHDGLGALTYLIAGVEAPVADSNERTKEALEDSVTARFMGQIRGDEEKFKKLMMTPTYKTVERMVRIWNANKEREYRPIGGEGTVWDARTTKLYDEVDKRLSGASNK